MAKSMNNSNSPGIILSSVSFSYVKDREILKNISLEIKPGTFLGVTGVNGSGKSTFSFLLNGLIPHFINGKLSGEVLVNGITTRSKSVSYFSEKIGMVFQNPDYSIFNLTVAEEIGFGLKNFHRRNIETVIRNSLIEVGLPGFEKRDPQTLSYGEKQKICLAGVLSLETDYIILDEPSAMLDYKSSVDIYEILRKLNKSGKTVIVIDHDTDFLMKYTVKTLILDKGKIECYGDTNAVLGEKDLLEKLGIKIPHQEDQS